MGGVTEAQKVKVPSQDRGNGGECWVSPSTNGADQKYLDWATQSSLVTSLVSTLSKTTGVLAESSLTGSPFRHCYEGDPSERGQAGTRREVKAGCLKQKMLMYL